MKLTIISDTHGLQEEFGTLSGDVLIHCGDMFNIFNSKEEDFERMDAWFSKQNFDLILCTGGNHDYQLEKRLSNNNQPFKDAVYLHGESYKYKDVNFFGAPWVPDLPSHAFYIEDYALSGKWAQIPNDVDVLITHVPPRGILDESSHGLILGCDYLLEAVEKTKPKLHCFGHVHASSGKLIKEGVTFINAAQFNLSRETGMEAFEFEI